MFQLLSSIPTFGNDKPLAGQLPEANQVCQDTKDFPTAPTSANDEPSCALPPISTAISSTLSSYGTNTVTFGIKNALAFDSEATQTAWKTNVMNQLATMTIAVYYDNCTSAYVNQGDFNLVESAYVMAALGAGLALLSAF